jgi:hypothetical protein
MGYDHSLITSTTTKPGTTLEQVVAAVEPITQALGIDGMHAFTKKNTVGDDLLFFFDPVTGELSIETCGEVVWTFDDYVKEAATNLGELTVDAGRFILSNHDTGDLDNAREYIYYGTDSNVVEKRFQDDLDDAMERLSVHLSKEAVSDLRQQAIQIRAGGNVA